MISLLLVGSIRHLTIMNMSKFELANATGRVNVSLCVPVNSVPRRAPFQEEVCLAVLYVLFSLGL